MSRERFLEILSESSVQPLDERIYILQKMYVALAQFRRTNRAAVEHYVDFDEIPTTRIQTTDKALSKDVYLLEASAGLQTAFEKVQHFRFDTQQLFNDFSDACVFEDVFITPTALRKIAAEHPDVLPEVRLSWQNPVASFSLRQTAAAKQLATRPVEQLLDALQQLPFVESQIISHWLKKLLEETFKEISVTPELRQLHKTFTAAADTSDTTSRKYLSKITFQLIDRDVSAVLLDPALSLRTLRQHLDTSLVQTLTEKSLNSRKTFDNLQKLQLGAALHRLVEANPTYRQLASGTSDEVQIRVQKSLTDFQTVCRRSEAALRRCISADLAVAPHKRRCATGR